jgi:hypothetical protein
MATTNDSSSKSVDSDGSRVLERLLVDPMLHDCDPEKVRNAARGAHVPISLGLEAIGDVMVHIHAYGEPNELPNTTMLNLGYLVSFLSGAAHEIMELQFTAGEAMTADGAARHAKARESLTGKKSRPKAVPR